MNTATKEHVAIQAFNETIRKDHENPVSTCLDIWEGVKYAQNEHVKNYEITDTTIKATVVGSGKGTSKYKVTLTNTNEDFSMTCTCALHKNQGKTCKHIAAVSAIAYASFAKNPCLCKECLLVHEGEFNGHPVKEYFQFDERNEWEREMFTTFVEVTDDNREMIQCIVNAVGDNRGEIAPGIDSLVSWLPPDQPISATIVTEENVADRVIVKNKKTRNSYAKRWSVGKFSDKFVEKFSKMDKTDTKAVYDFAYENMYKRCEIDRISE